MVSEGARPWGRGRSGDCDYCVSVQSEKEWRTIRDRSLLTSCQGGTSAERILVRVILSSYDFSCDRCSQIVPDIFEPFSQARNGANTVP